MQHFFAGAKKVEWGRRENRVFVDMSKQPNASEPDVTLAEEILRAWENRVNAIASGTAPGKRSNSDAKPG